ncbi:hypothetical protein BC827DRAFT_1247909 [Russula dissimulans]|nr:hypothetical protein BC827DRAFT_1247909 [Russula dissimulans]
MILNEQDVPQLPKLLEDPSVGPTNRVPPEIDVPVAGSSSRPLSPNTTLPSYDALEAQQIQSQKREARRFWHTRAGRLLVYALVIYGAILILVGVPAFMLPPPPPPGHQFGLAPQAAPQLSFSCNNWDEPGKPVTGSAMMRLALSQIEAITLQLNSSSQQELKGYVSGSLTVNMNQDKTESRTLLVANARYSNFNLFKASSVCQTRFGNNTDIMINIPERPKDSSDTIEMDLQLLLPWTPPTSVKSLVTSLPTFKQVLGTLSPAVFFERLKLAGSGSSVTVGSVSGSSIFVKTSGAQISGNFNASRRIYLDTVNGAVFANVTLHNNKKQEKHTRLSIDTGNGPIVANIKLDLDENVYFTPPKRHNFKTTFKTFNAPMNVSIAHIQGSKPSRLSLLAENSQGPMDVSLDALYTGTFNVRTKDAPAQVLQTPVSAAVRASITGKGHEDGGGDDDDEDNSDDFQQKHGLHFARKSTEWLRGWIGDDQKPEMHDRRTLGGIELRNSLGPIRVHLARLKPQPPATAIRRR